MTDSRCWKNCWISFSKQNSKILTFSPPQPIPTQCNLWLFWPNLTEPNPWVDPTHVHVWYSQICALWIQRAYKSSNQRLTGKDEGDEAKQEAAQPKDETRQDYLWYERLSLAVFGVHLSIASHGIQHNLPGVSITHHVCNTWLMWWCWRYGRICQLCLS